MAQNTPAEVGMGVVVGDFPPAIESVKTYCLYIDESNNVPCTSFADGAVVYVVVKASDPTGADDITSDGFVKVKIVLWNGSEESEFTRFGPSYLNAALFSSSGYRVTYLYAFRMSTDDANRLGTETPPLYYRVKAQVSDGVSIVESNSSNLTQNADYTYRVNPLPPPPPGPTRYLFDVTIDVPSDKKMVRPGDSFYATVAVTKQSPPGDIEITLIYRISDPRNLTIDYYTETVTIGNSTIYRVPLMRIPEDATPGFYVFKASVSYTSVVAWSEAVFNVVGGLVTTNPATTTEPSTTLPVTSTTRRPSGGGGGGLVVNYPVTVSPVEVRKAVTISKYPAEVSAFSGDSKPVMVVVENTGDVDVSDVKVDIGGLASVAKITPTVSGTIGPGSARLFIIEIAVPDYLSAGSYDMTLKAVGGEASDERYVKLVVLDRPKEPEPELNKRLLDMSRLIEDVWAQAVNYGMREDDQKMSKVFDSLRAAKESLARARKEWAERNYNQTSYSLNETQRNIEESVIQLASMKPKQTQVKEVRTTTETLVYTLPPLYWAIAITAIVVTSFLAYERMRRIGPGRKIEERYDLRRMKDMIFGRISRHPGGGSYSSPGEKDNI